MKAWLKNKTLGWILFFLLLALVCTALFWGSSYRWSAVWRYRELFFRGWLYTVGIACASLSLSVLIGLLFALLRRCPIALLQSASTFYVFLIRGTPFLVQILFFYYIVAYQAGLENRYVAGIAILSVFTGAYITEIIRAGIEGISASQLETARALGFTTIQTYRLVILPQAFKQILPPLAGQLASLIKDSSLLSVIGISEMTFSAQQINSATFSTLETFFPLAFGYLILTLPITLLSNRLEKRFSYET